ncbi:MAG: hypothetical protein WCP21_06730, partial [Armatimonadota bacterium]
MNWLRYSGRIILALGTIAIGLWATHEELLPVPPSRFWLGLLCYLLVAEVVWTLIETRTPRAEAGLARQGLHRLARQARRAGSPRKSLYEGARVGLADILTDSDIIRDAHQGLLATLLTRESRPRLHVIAGEPGSGRSTLLLRLGQALAQQDQTVFVGLPTVALPGLSLVIEAAKKGQAYLLLDDLDLRPQAEEWLYEVMRVGWPVVVIATARQTPEAAADKDGLEALCPAGFLSQATLHRPQVTANDFAALARKLAQLGLKHGAELPADGQTDLVVAVRRLRGQEPPPDRWQGLDGEDALLTRQKALVALCGVAELGLPESLWGQALGEKALPRWERAGLLTVEDKIASPPHHGVCLEFLRQLEAREAVVAEVLQSLVPLAAEVSPEFVPRLVFGLAYCEELAAPARAWVAGLRPVVPQADWPAALQRLWRHALDALDIPCEVEPTGDTPPELSLLVNMAFDRADYAGALGFSRRLGRDGVYQASAHFNAALALAHLGRLAEAGA